MTLYIAVLQQLYYNLNNNNYSTYMLYQYSIIRTIFEQTLSLGSTITQYGKYVEAYNTVGEKINTGVGAQCRTVQLRL